MKSAFWILVVLIAAFGGGCANDSYTRSIAQYTPGKQAWVGTPPYAGFFLLWKWTPSPWAASQGHPFRAGTHEQLLTVYVDQNMPLGFRHSNGQLLAVAGPTTRPLPEAYYLWQTLPGRKSDDQIPASLQQSEEGSADCYASKSFVDALIDAFFDSLFDALADHGFDKDGRSGHGGAREQHHANHGNPQHRDRDPNAYKDPPTSSPAEH